MRHALSKRCAGLGLLVAVGCGPAPVPLAAPGTVGNPGATQRTPLESAQRPEVMRSFPMDYGAIPHLVVQPMSAEDHEARIGFASTSSLGDPRVSGALMVEVEAQGQRTFTQEPLPKEESKAGVRSRVCEGRAGTIPVSWEGLSLLTWTDEFIDYVRYEGDFDGATCLAKPSRVARVRAPAVIPGIAYAFRTCVPVCQSAPEPGSEELLVLITPRSQWVGATVPWLKLQTSPHVGLFTRLIVPMKKGGAASTFVHVDARDAVTFTQMRKGRAGRAPDLPAAGVVQFGFDFSWPEADPFPVGIGFVGAVQTGGPGAASGAPINF